LNEEASGYMLVPAAPLPDGWQAIDDATASEIWGRGNTTQTDATGPQNEDEKTPNNCDCGDCGGMCGYSVALMMVSLSLMDTPVRYTPPVGDRVSFTITYNQRESHQPQTFTYSNLGQKWTFGWLSYAQDDPNNANANVDIFLNGGGQDTFTGIDPVTSVYAPETRKHTTLKRVSTNPIRYERTLPDGSVDVFTQTDGAAGFPRRVFMTERRNARGNALTFTYDQQVRLVAVTDAIGQVTTLAYDLVTDPWKITRVTDPFGRSATFSYDASGLLQSSTDTIGLRSSYTYAADGFVRAVTTPYGTSRFYKSEVGGNRTVDITDALGGKERVEYRSTDGAATESAVPAVPGFTFTNNYMQYRNSFYWDKRGMVAGAGDRTKAHLYHWLHVKGNVNQTSGILESEKAPLENRVWYLYPNQVSSVWEGDGRQPTVVARVLDNGATQASLAEYNGLGGVTKRTDPLGRETTYTYATNNIDVTQVKQTTGGINQVLASFTYDTRHLPLTIMDAAGQTTTLTYNTAGQVLTITNAKSETTTLAYTGGYLQSVSGAVAGATTAFSYDSYGRVRTTTDPDSYVATYDYDAADRPTAVTFPDGSSTATVYDRLDVARTKDRAGRWTSHTYDALRDPITTRDPLGRTVTRAWCTCGGLDSLKDGNGNLTQWERDLQGRVTKETRANAAFTSYVYETTTSRLKTITDRKSQVVTYTYALDDRLTQAAYTNAEHATPTVSFTYETAYPRLATMVDGTGTTSYAYKAVGTLGARQVASVDGPLTNDTITYDYDELGRVTGRAINSVGLTRTFDALSRLTGEANPLGTFAYTYQGVTGRVDTTTYPNGQTTTYSYLGNTGDQWLQTIHHRKADSSTLSKFDYTYDVVGNIQSWTQQADSAAATVYQFGYDVADQLTQATQRTTDPTPVTLKRFAYTYDAAGNRATEQIDNSVVSATHDNVNRMTAQTIGGALRFGGNLNELGTVTVQGQTARVDANYRFSGSAPVTTGTTTVTIAATDASGNQSQQAFEVDQAGTGATLTYDANGNLTGDGTRTFTWDAENRLLTVTIGTKTSEFTYDGLDRSVRIVEKDGGATTSDKRFIWCGLQLCEERDATGGTVTKRFLVQGTQVNGVSYFYARDHLGTIRELTDGTGTLRARYDYDPWGRRTKLTGDKDADFGFTGHFEHSPTGLTLAPYRAYASSLGRWISEDPSGMVDGPNLFAYVDGGPIDYVDPTGEGALAVIGGIAGGLVGFVGGGGLALASGGILTPEIVITTAAGQALGTATGLVLENAIESTKKLIDDLNQKYSKGGKQNKRDSGLADISPEEISRRARDKSLTPEERRRYQTEEKARGDRNKQKRNKKC
jgi:RHS repeat-associated protein